MSRDALQNSLRANSTQNRDAVQGGFRTSYRDISARNPTKQSTRVWDETAHGVLQSFPRLAHAAIVLFFSGLAASLPAHATETQHASFKKTNWSGVYIGLNIGQGSQTHSTECISGTWDCSVLPISNPMQKASGNFYGGHIGYNWKIHANYILGIEANVFRPHINGAATFPTVGQYKSSETKYDTLKTLQLRLGRDFGESLIYLSGGLAWTKLETTFANRYNNGEIINDPNGFLSHRNTSRGHVLGIGAEHALNGSMSLSAELARARFPSHQFDISTQINGGIAQGWAFEKVNPGLTLFKIAVNYRH